MFCVYSPTFTSLNSLWNLSSFTGIFTVYSYVAVLVLLCSTELLEVAVIVTLPATPLNVTRPLLSTDATFVFDDLYLTGVKLS